MAVASVSAAAAHDSNGRTHLTDEFSDLIDVDRRRVREMVGIAYGGIVAEEIVFGRDGVSIGASDDVSRATELLRRLNANAASSVALGPIDVDALESGRESDRGAERMRSTLWDAVRMDAAVAMERVRMMLEPRRQAIEALAEAVLAASDRTLAGTELSDVLTRLLGDDMPTGGAGGGEAERSPSSTRRES